MSSAEDRKRVLDRIKKCLSLSKSSEPHEAAAALRQAQKLMEIHNVTLDDIERIDVEDATYRTTEQWRKRLPIYLVAVTSLVEAAMGVKAVYEYEWVNYKPRTIVRYFGPKGRAQLAVYVHTVIMRTLQSSWKEYAARNPWVNDQKGARAGYWLGWIAAVRSTVIAFGGAKEEPRAGAGTELVPTQFGREMAKIDSAIAARYQGALRDADVNNVKQYRETRDAGKQAAASFNLHKPMGGANQRALSHDN